jgi:hypothetical protein
MNDDAFSCCEETMFFDFDFTLKGIHLGFQTIVAGRVEQHPCRLAIWKVGYCSVFRARKGWEERRRGGGFRPVHGWAKCHSSMNVVLLQAVQW